MLLFELDEIKVLASIVDDFFCDRNSSYANLMEEIILECVDPKECLIEFFTGYIVMAPAEQIEESIELFFEIPFEQMPLYFFPKPYSKRKPSKTACPSLEEGPYPWQVILARWRTKLQR
jgi:hypothetical protein